MSLSCVQIGAFDKQAALGIRARSAESGCSSSPRRLRRLRVYLLCSQTACDHRRADREGTRGEHDHAERNRKSGTNEENAEPLSGG